MPRHLISNLLGLVGAIVGGVLGFYTFGWLLEHGFLGLMIPGALLGLGCSLLARHPSFVRGVVCAIAALGLSFFADWWFEPFNADSSLQYFLLHAMDLGPVRLLMIGIGTFIAFWVGKDAGLRGYSRLGRPAVRPAQDRGPAKADEERPISGGEA
ncbi:MAG: hypothetical protein ACHRXM_08320 [Isosphaerales bacterium]